MVICKARSTLIIKRIEKNINSDESNTPFQIKKCYVRLEKLAYVERAIASGSTTIWIDF